MLGDVGARDDRDTGRVIEFHRETGHILERMTGAAPIGQHRQQLRSPAHAVTIHIKCG